MKELGEYLKEKRKENGVGLEEAAEDLNLSRDDVENIEAGNIRAFRDVLKLKVMVKDYAKYLGLDPEKVVDEFNDFLFEHTSKISLEDILEAKQKKEEEEKKIVSPYTKSTKKHFNIEKLLKLKPLFITLMIILLLLLVIFIYIKIASERKPSNRNVELMNVRSEEYEFA
ncbi:MAG: helix-turn-helix domain-containing protein [Bacilli bacterium]|nr:helix-turn-helix domain-containing protein [Bacilli bacterium]